MRCGLFRSRCRYVGEDREKLDGRMYRGAKVGSASNLIMAVENDDRVRSGRDGTIAAEPCFALTSITSPRSTAMPDKDLNELFLDTLPKRPSTPKPLRGKS
jgi:hypothetical protein